MKQNIIANNLQYLELGSDVYVEGIESYDLSSEVKGVAKTNFVGMFVECKNNEMSFEFVIYNENSKKMLPFAFGLRNLHTYKAAELGTAVMKIIAIASWFSTCLCDLENNITCDKHKPFDKFIKKEASN